MKFFISKILTSLITTGLVTSTVFSAEMTWKAWSEATRAEAAERAVPLYIVIGDSLSELTTSMREDTFANDEVAAFLNENFVCVYADRSDAPGIAAYGQQWLVADQKIPGWPLDLWFTPNMEPLEAASYLPPTEEWGREGFMVVANRVVDGWASNREGGERSAQRRTELIADYLPFAAEPIGDMAAALQTAAEDWLALLNPETGLFGDSPHRAEPELLRFLIGQGGEARAAALKALRIRVASSLRDPIDGGFYRATSDTNGGIPVFQKRLTDQARIALAFLDAAAVSDDPIFAAGAHSALDYAINRLSPGDGTFWVGEDATDPNSTRNQTWIWDALAELTGDEFANRLAAKSAGNVDAEEDLERHHSGRNILRADPTEQTSRKDFELRTKVLTTRLELGNPRIERTATAGAHGLMLHALNRATVELNDLNYGGYAVAVRSAIRRDFDLAAVELTRVAHADVPALPDDYLLIAMGMNDPTLVQQADDLFYDDKFGLYYATAGEVAGVRPQMWSAAPGELPSPAVWRLLIGNPPELLADEITLAFDNPDAPPPGDVLLALQKHDRSK